MDSKEPVYVDGVIFNGSVIYDRLKGIGWDSGRTCSLTLRPNPLPESDVIAVDLAFGKLRRFFWIEVQGQGEWRAEDFLDSFREHIKVKIISPIKDSLLKVSQ